MRGVRYFIPATSRDVVCVLAGVALSICLRQLLRFQKKRSRRQEAWTKTKDTRDDDIIKSMDDLRALMPAGSSGSAINDARKVIDHLDEQMIHFISKSPFLQLGTIHRDDNKDSKDAAAPFISPKGDEPGFVSVLKKRNKGTTVIIPDRPGNRLIFGLQVKFV